MADFRTVYPEYEETRKIDELRATEYSYLDECGQVYLDYTGAGLAARSQSRAHAARIATGCFGNPHSENPTSSASTRLIEQARAAVLRHFNTTRDEYAVIFTPNATGACRLVGEAYPFRRHGRLVLTADNHNSVNGLREFARARGARVAYVPMTAPELRVSEAGLDWIDAIGTDLIHRRVSILTGWLLESLGRLKHGNGALLIRLYGPAGLAPRLHC